MYYISACMYVSACVLPLVEEEGAVYRKFDLQGVEVGWVEMGRIWVGCRSGEEAKNKRVCVSVCVVGLFLRLYSGAKERRRFGAHTPSMSYKVTKRGGGGSEMEKYLLGVVGLSCFWADVPPHRRRKNKLPSLNV